MSIVTKFIRLILSWFRGESLPEPPNPAQPPAAVVFDDATADGKSRCPLVVCSGPTRLPGFQAICVDIDFSSTGKGLYLSVHREKRDFRNLYDLKYYDFATGVLTYLADLGSDSSYYKAFLEDKYYRTKATEAYKTHRILCFRDAQFMSIPSGGLVIESLDAANGKLLARGESQLLVLDDHNVLGRIPVDRDLASVVWGHPSRNILLLDYRVYDSSKGGIDYDTPAQYVVLEFDDSCGVTRRQPVSLVPRGSTCGWFADGHANDVVFAEYADQDQVSAVKSLNVDTLAVTTLVDRVTAVRSVQAHPSGLLFFGDEVQKNRSMVLRVLDRRSGNTHVLGTLTGGAFMGLSLSEDWRRLVFRNILDTTGQGKYYDWEDDSEVFTMELDFREVRA